MTLKGDYSSQRRKRCIGKGGIFLKNVSTFGIYYSDYSLPYNLYDINAIFKALDGCHIWCTSTSVVKVTYLVDK